MSQLLPFLEKLEYFRFGIFTVLMSDLIGILFSRCQIEQIDCGVGSCTNSFWDFECDCQIGAQHEDNDEKSICFIDYCSGNPCHYGSCTNDKIDKKYSCNCYQGFELKLN